MQQMALPFGGTIAFPKVECREPYALIGTTSGFTAGGSSEGGSYTGCIYPYQRGIRVHIVMVSTTTHSGGLGGLINEGIKGVMFGSDEGMAERYLDQIQDALLCRLPEAVLNRQSKEAEPAGAMPQTRVNWFQSNCTARLTQPAAHQSTAQPRLAAPVNAEARNGASNLAGAATRESPSLEGTRETSAKPPQVQAAMADIARSGKPEIPKSVLIKLE